ncbi:hypothetical protein AMJ52_03855 [candidate division TA06 bacterium DG_78]|jgi:hypothetical protein|uniref:Uncharacterized protein n=1 Tax=candidate division TA06 bacterium DG_78 TaxID=1703772 RepID=A0A0S7YFY4_UNCT6|nr:MAG: hypothetical protein AMJ52_03855 [candidate division TA06 bacterium DG_78]
MIRNHRIFQHFERKFLENEKVDIWQNFKIYEALYQEALTLGVVPLRNPLEDIDIDIKIARVINSVPKPA